jgi:hypothetical protein
MKTELIRGISVVLLAAASVYAQGFRTLKVQVPFGFHVGAATLPSGEYTVDTNAAQGVVVMRSADTKSSAIILTNAIEAPTAPNQGKLVFNRYGNQYFLSQIWKPGDSTGREIHRTRGETEAAANARRGLESIVASK